MRTLMKIILIFTAFIITAGIIVALKGENKSGVGGPMGIILLFGFIAGARAIWKYKTNKNNHDQPNANDNHNLDKR